METVPADSLSETLRASFAREVRRGVQLSILGNALALGIYLVLLVIQSISAASNGPYGGLDVVFSLVSLGGAIVIVWLNYFLASRAKNPLIWCFVFMLVGTANFLQVAGFGWLPAAFSAYPRFLAVRYQDVLSLAFALALFALPLSRAFLALTTALFAIVFTAAVVISFVHAPGAQLFLGPFDADAATFRTLTDPWTFTPDLLAIEIVLLCALAAFLILAVGDGRRFVVAHVRAEADRAVLSRFLPPALAARIAGRGEPRIAAARRQAAILFVDRDLLQQGDPADLTALHDFYVAVEAVLFEHDAVLDRFTGGPVMASFGALDEDGEAAAKALASAREIVRSFAGRVRIALHTGSVVVGEVGSDRSRCFGVVGGAINIARRVLDQAPLSRTSILATDDFVAATGEGRAGLTAMGSVVLRGRAAPIQLWAVGS